MRYFVSCEWLPALSAYRSQFSKLACRWRSAGDRFKIDAPYLKGFHLTGAVTVGACAALATTLTPGKAFTAAICAVWEDV